MNTPYVKQYNELGELTNPIEGALRHPFPNRRARRSKQPRFMSNKRGTRMLIVGSDRYFKRVQWIAANVAIKKNKDVYQAERYVIHYDLAPKR